MKETHPLRRKKTKILLEFLRPGNLVKKNLPEQLLFDFAKEQGRFFVVKTPLEIER